MVTPRRASDRSARADSEGRELLQDSVAGFDEHDLGFAGIERAELAAHVMRDLGNLTGHLHTGGATTDDHERQPGRPPLRIGFELGRLERPENPSPDLESTFERLQIRGWHPPVVMTEVVVLGARGNDECVVRQRLGGGLAGSLPQPYQASVEIDVAHLGEQDGDVCVTAKDAPQRIGDLRRRQRAGRHLVSQRLEQVEVASIDEGDVHRKPGEVQRGLDPAKPAADDDDSGAISDIAFHESRTPRVRQDSIGNPIGAIVVSYRPRCGLGAGAASTCWRFLSQSALASDRAALAGTARVGGCLRRGNLSRSSPPTGGNRGTHSWNAAAV